MSVLVLCRHGQSEWNLQNLFTGWRDPALTPLGIEEAKRAGQKLGALNLKFDVAYTSALVRAQDTCRLILDEMHQSDCPVIRDAALNERDYGELSGLNKTDAAKEFGESQVRIWRRSFDVPPPSGESLKDTAARVMPYYDAQIRPRLLKGDDILIAAHGNSLRALVMSLENLSRDQILQREIATGIPLIYEMDAIGEVSAHRELT